MPTCGPSWTRRRRTWPPFARREQARRLSLGKPHQCPPDNLQFSRRAYLHQQFFWRGGATRPSLRTRGRHRRRQVAVRLGTAIMVQAVRPFFCDGLPASWRHSDHAWKARLEAARAASRLDPASGCGLVEQLMSRTRIFFFRACVWALRTAPPWISSRDAFRILRLLPTCLFVSGFLRVSSLSSWTQSLVACLQSCPPLGSSSHRWPKGERRCAARLELD